MEVLLASVHKMRKKDKRVTLSEIAQASGFSRTAVSYALRNDPNTAESTRKHIQAVAKKLGYQPDPLISKLMLRLHGESKRLQGSTIAFLNAGDDKEFIRRTPALHDFFESARIRARHHGYRTEEFWLNNPKCSRNRLAQILEARGIRGILLGSTGHPNSSVEFAWDRFATVTVGYSISEPRLHRVVTHHYQNAQLALRKIAAEGYHRIGLVIDPEMEQTMQNLHLAALLAHQYEFADESSIPPCVGMDELPAWFNSHEPDAIIYGTVVPESLFRDYGIPSKVPLISLVDAGRNGLVEGICPAYDKLGAVAIDLLADQLLHDEYGIPEDPKIVLMNGYWVKPKKTSDREHEKC